MNNQRLSILSLLSIILFVMMFSAKVSAISVLSYNLNISDPSNHSIIETNQVNLQSVLLVINTEVDSSCRYSATKGLSYDAMESNFEYEYGTLHKRTISSLIDGQYKAYVRCKNLSNTISQELEIIYSVSLPITATISLENGPNLKDGKTEITLMTSKIPKTAPTLSYTTDSSTFKQIPLVGGDKVWTGYIIIPTDRQDEVGSFKFQARDLEDNIGTEITSGAIFTIDTIAPNALLDLKAEGISKGINLTWKTDEDKLTFNIYRSTSSGVSYSNFYKKVNKGNYVDTDVSAKTAYYYKISSLDASGNEGSLSGEIYAISSLTDTSSSTTLDLRYVSLVESLVQKIDSTSATLNSLSSVFNSQGAEESEMYDYLKLENSITSAKSGIVALRSEVNGYKAQALSKADLDKKLNSAEVRLNIIKSSVPQRLRISDQVTISNTVSENDINSNILEIKPSLDYDQLNKMSEDSLKYVRNNEFSVSGEAYNIEVTYLDESQKTFTLIKKTVELRGDNANNASIIEVIPKDIAESSKDLSIYNKDYTVLKDDPIISFSPNTKEIVYFVKENLDLSSLSKTYTFVMKDDLQEYSSALGINGYLSLSQFSDNLPPANITIGIVLIVGLGIYLVVVKSKRRSIRLEKLEDNINELNNNLYEGNINMAVQRYSDISQIYKGLSQKDKDKVFSELNKLHQRLLQAKKSAHGHRSVKSSAGTFTIFIAMMVIVASFAVAIGGNYTLFEGKNNITLSERMDVKRLIYLNPEIESVTYDDPYLNERFAYINVFGGIGKSFTLEPEISYEVISKENKTLITDN